MHDNTERAQRILSALERYDLKKVGTNQYRCNSPLRPGSNSHAFCVTIDDDAGGGGLWHDKVTDEGGNFITLEPFLPGFVAPTVRTPTAPEVTTAYNGVDDYAQAQGVPGDVLRAAGWRKGMYYCPQTRRERLALLFETKTGTRARFIDGLKPKYMSPSGYHRSWYHLEPALHIAEATGQPLTIGNGEASALVAQYWGVAATAITGGGENGIPDELLEELRACYQGPIIVCLDSDEAGRRGSAKMVATLRAANYEVRAVDLNGPKGFDLANFTKLHQHGTPAALLALEDLPEPQPVASSAEVARLQHQIAHLQGIIVEQQRDIDTMKAEQRWQNDLLQNDTISATDKITILVVRRELAVQAHRAPEPEAPRPVNFTSLAKRLGNSTDSVSRCVKKFNGITWERREVTMIDAESGQPRTQISLVPLPALDRPEAIQPSEPRKHGGRRVRCPKCHSDNVEASVVIACKNPDCLETTIKPIQTIGDAPEAHEVLPDAGDETPEPAAPVPQVAALNYAVHITLEQSVSPVPQVAAQTPEPASPSDPADYQRWHAPPAIASHVNPDKVKFVRQKLPERGPAWARQYMSDTVEGWDAWPAALRDAVEQAERKAEVLA